MALLLKKSGKEKGKFFQIFMSLLMKNKQEGLIY